MLSAGATPSGCGSGENALFFAERGYKVTGIDFLAEPISRAKQKAAERGLSVSFLVMDALALTELPEVFDNVIDTSELQRDFDVQGFMAPFVVVRRKSDDVRGSLTFQHSPRLYFDFQADQR